MEIYLGINMSDVVAESEAFFKITKKFDKKGKLISERVDILKSLAKE